VKVIEGLTPSQAVTITGSISSGKFDDLRTGAFDGGMVVFATYIP
jgi:hypothetical protein